MYPVVEVITRITQQVVIIQQGTGLCPHRSVNVLGSLVNRYYGFGRNTGS